MIASYKRRAGDGSNHAILELMGNIAVASAGIRHKYSTVDGNELYLGGKLRFGTPKPISFKSVDTAAAKSNPVVELDLSYHHTKTKGWRFEATVSPGNKSDKFKVIDMLKGLVSDPDELPEFVQNLEVPLSELSAKLVCTKTETGHVVFALRITVGNVDISLAQIRSTAAAKAVAEGVTGSATDTGPGRLLRVALTKLPPVPAMPVIGAVVQPFDQLGIVWTNRDITADEINALNANVFTTAPLLSRTAKTATDLEPLLQGFHFQVALLENGRSKLLLDHVMGKKKEPQPKQEQGAKSPGGDAGEEETKSSGDDATEPEAQADAGNTNKTVAPVSKSFGPLSVSNIGLSVEGKSMSTVQVSVDATLTLGPISMSLLGFSFSVDLSQVKSLEDLAMLPFKPSIQGMAVEFNKPPTRLAGLFLTFDDVNESGFLGAIAVSVAA